MTNTYVPIATTVLAANATEITFTGLPQTFGDYAIEIRGIYQNASNSAFVRLNGNNQAIYQTQTHQAAGTSQGGSAATRDSSLLTITAAGAGVHFNAHVDLIGIYDTDRHKMLLQRYGHTGVSNHAATRFGSTLAVGTITVGATQGLATGTVVSIYGVHR